MPVRLLVVNAGSSSLKLRVLDGDDGTLADRELEWERGAQLSLADALAELPAADAIAHRVVHGGELRSATWIDAGVRARLAQLARLAPLHQPRAIAAIDAAAKALPGVPAIACFDTSFHSTLPPAARTYALPAAWRTRWPLRRYGFHGLSHAYAARRASEMLERPLAEISIVTCHLGAGASLAAVAGGRSVDTTMGFTPTEGLVMATRPGSVDPGLVLWLIEHGGLSPADVADGIERGSGLAGLAGTPDMRRVIERADGGDEEAVLAFDVYVHRLRAGVAAMAAALGGIDALAFTGGVGERAPAVRSAAAAGLGFLGVALDQERNAAAAPDAEIGAPAARVRTVVVEAREDLEIARQVRTLASATGPAPTRRP